MGNKKSFFEKLTGSIKFNNEEEFDTFEDQYEDMDEVSSDEEEDNHVSHSYEEEVGELSVDMYRTSSAIVIKTMVAGIQKSEIDITLTRDQVIIEGSRQSDASSVQEVYFEELYWGAFERVITLPEEVDIELAEAHEEHGLLTLTLPLVDRNRQARLRIK